MEQTQHPLSLTATAIAEVKAIIADKNMGDVGLRIGVTKGGCSGMSYQLNFEKTVNPQDMVFEVENVRVIVDPTSMLYLTGMTLDFSRNLVGGGFKFINPNAKQTCGCGESFSA